jgi:hypothetical protein
VPLNTASSAFASAGGGGLGAGERACMSSSKVESLARFPMKRHSATSRSRKAGTATTTFSSTSCRGAVKHGSRPCGSRLETAGCPTASAA